MAEMADAKKYHVDPVRDDIFNLDEVLQNIATRQGHVRIVSIIWQPARPAEDGTPLPAGYIIISEMAV